ncbi:Cof-type HAD-IIB family hydrolase [bacterium]|nr:Cof-type HAD-IIB family hydrolase [bacterium]
MTVANQQSLLIAIDVDGTLLNTEVDDLLGAREIAALEAVRTAGHVVALCTGRNLNSTRILLEKSAWFPEDLPLVLLNGAVVWGGNPRRQITCNVLDEAAIRALVALYKEHGTAPMVYSTDDHGGVLYHEKRPVNDILDRYLQYRRDHVGAIIAVEDLQDVPWTEALEVGTIDREAPIRSLTSAVKAALDGRVRVINTQSLLGKGEFFWAEAFHVASNKGAGMMTLAGSCGIPLQRLVAIGDNFNDLDMFAAAALSVAMGNSPDEVKIRADLVAGHVAEGGAADILLALASGELVVGHERKR